MDKADITLSRKALPSASGEILLSPSPYLTALQEGPASAADSLGLMAFALMLYRRKWTLVSMALAGAIIAVVVSVFQPRMYRSVAILEIQSANEDFLNLKDINPTATPPGYSDESYIQTQAELLRQDWLIERAVHKMKLVQLPEFTPKPDTWGRLRAVVGLSPAPLPPAEKYATEVIQGNLRVVPTRGSRVINVAYEAPDPVLAAGFANTLAQTFIEQSIEARWNAAREVREWLRPQLDELKSRLEESEERLQSYLTASGLQLTSGEENLAADKLRLVQAELSKTQADRITKQSLYYTVLKSQMEIGGGNPVMQEYRLRLTDIRRQLADLNTLLTPENYKIVRLNAQIAELEGAIQKELASTRNRLQQDYEAARDQEALLEQVYNRQSGLMTNITSKMVRYNTLKREVETTRQFYEAMMQKANEAGIASVVRPSNIRFASPAQPPLRPSRPNVPLNTVLGIFTSLLLGISFVAMKDHHLRRLRMPGDSAVYLGLPELGAIPATPLSGFRKLLGAGEGDGRLALVSWEQKLSAVSESFRGTVDSILSASVNGSVPRILVVTSPLPGEGKTTVVSNLAITLAGFNRRVLLIDGDLRRPRLHDIFDLTNNLGLSSLLRRNTGIESLPLEALAHRTSVPNLSVLLSGPGTDDIASLLHSSSLEKLMRRYREEFEYVLIDAPPSLRFTDARLLAHHADGVVLVVRADHTNDKTALATIQNFAMAGVPVLGTILNAWDPSLAEIYGYQGYGHLYRTEESEN